jgi:hypothetical protein
MLVEVGMETGATTAAPKNNSAICSVAHEAMTRHNEAVTKHDEAGRVQHYPVKRPLSHSYQNKPASGSVIELTVSSVQD